MLPLKSKTKNMKKIVYGFLALFMLASVSSNLSFATENKGGFGSEVASGWVRGQGFDDDQANFLNWWARWVWGNTAMKGDSILTSVKKFINWALGMLATVALVLYIHRHKQQVKAKNTITTK